jgi:hypothetical protein
MARFISIVDHCIPGGSDPEKEVPDTEDGTHAETKSCFLKQHEPTLNEQAIAPLLDLSLMGRSPQQRSPKIMKVKLCHHMRLGRA